MGENIVYAHAGAGNHGCEAIVRASSKLLGPNIRLYSSRPEEDYKYSLHKVVKEIRHDKDNAIKKNTFPWFLSRIETKLNGRINCSIYFRKKGMFDDTKKGDIAFSIGGDNYCYPGTDVLGAQNVLFRKKGAKTVLWGCSVEPDLLKDTDVAKDLSYYNLIVARESISYNALKDVNENTVLIPDPAFALDHVDCPLPKGWIEGKMIGINASPLIFENASNEKLVFDAYIELIRYILQKTDFSVVLIPHVVWECNDDRIPLQKLYDMFKDTKRVILLEDHNCMELKGYIGRCRMFIGARTHATIAAYSMCVPTLVLGYSVKSRGIARDLFGTEENYVIPVQKVCEKNELVEAFKWLKMHEDEIKTYMIWKIPDYIKSLTNVRSMIAEFNIGEQ